MKTLLIIVALVAVSFIALLAYGAGRDEQPKRACERLPAFGADSEPDEDDLEDWCPPSFAERTRGLQARFAPGIGRTKHVIEVRQPGASFPVPPEPDEEVRMAKLKLLSGSFVLIRATPEDASICLCAEGAPIPPPHLTGGCDSRWRKKHSGRAVCQGNFDSGGLVFGPTGGALQFGTVGPPARVQVQ